jgi:ubiquitin-conjugating enzyme E2 J2
MVENNPTMGSIETSDYEKKVLAKQSLDVNLSNKTFVDLFPDLVNEIRERKKKLAASDKKSVSGKVTELGNTIRSHGLRAGQNNNNKKEAGFLSSLISTTVVLVVFVAFLYTVRYVLQTISSQTPGSVS